MPDCIARFFPVEEKTVAKAGELTLASANLDIKETQNEAVSPSIFDSVTKTDVLFLLWLLGATGIFVWQIVSYFRLFILLHTKSNRKVNDGKGNTIYLFAEDIPSMSWMNCILLSEDDYRNHHDEILAHEYAHIAKGHSWDRLLMSLCQIAQWFNPFVWLCSDTLSEIHEYEADRCVICNGINIRQYQYLLISKAAGPATFAMVNGFNHSQLKSRIIMMNRTTPKPLSKARYLVLLPMLFVAFIVSAQEKADNIEWVKAVQIVPTSSLEDNDKPIYMIGEDIFEDVKAIDIDAISGSEIFRKNASKPGTKEIFEKIKDKYPNKNTVIVLQLKPGMDAHTNTVTVHFGVTGEKPLFLVDGKKVNLDDIDPKTIESLEVLKKGGVNQEIFDKYIDKYPEAANGIILIKLKPTEVKPTVVVYYGTKSYDNEEAKEKYSIAVFDEDNKPITGAIVRVKGTKNGAITGENGICKIEATSGQTLSILFVGFESQEITLTGNLATTVVLKKE